MLEIRAWMRYENSTKSLKLMDDCEKTEINYLDGY